MWQKYLYFLSDDDGDDDDDEMSVSLLKREYPEETSQTTYVFEFSHSN